MSAILEVSPHTWDLGLGGGGFDPLQGVKYSPNFSNDHCE